MTESLTHEVEEAWQLLSPEIRRVVYGMGWKTLWPVQVEAIKAVASSNSHVLVASPTASGKTEAVFLPILSRCISTVGHQLNVIYVSPLKALINDQYRRVGSLCESLGVKVTRWHQDASRSAKATLMKEPGGVLQITPESLESLFINRQESLTLLFENVEFIIVDEIHSFQGTSRGVHLRSLLHRLGTYSKRHIRLLGLSATVGDLEAVREWLAPPPSDVVVVKGSGPQRKTRYALFHYPQPVRNQSSADALEPLASHIRRLTREHSGLIFCNTRAKVEELAHSLNMDGNYLVHHGSLSDTERGRVELELKTATKPTSVVATSSLEMGVDIGAVDLVVQVDATWSVESLVQRMGRSGRREGADCIAALFTTDDENLLQSAAVLELFLEGWLEPKPSAELPLDVLYHQILSMVEERHGIQPDELLNQLTANPSFMKTNLSVIQQVIEDMVKSAYLSYLAGPDELIIGPEGEPILRNRDFYSVFESVLGYAVEYNGRELGRLPHWVTSWLRGRYFLLAGRPWQVDTIDRHARKVTVKSVENAPALPWMGGFDVVNINHAIRTKMVELVSVHKNLPYLNEAGAIALGMMRTLRQMRGLGVDDREIAYGKAGCVRFNAFAGTRIQRTLLAMIRAVSGVHMDMGAYGSLVTSTWWQEKPLHQVLRDIIMLPPTKDDIIGAMDEGVDGSTKYGRYLSPWARYELQASMAYDIPGTLTFLDSIRVVTGAR